LRLIVSNANVAACSAGHMNPDDDIPTAAEFGKATASVKAGNVIAPGLSSKPSHGGKIIDDHNTILSGKGYYAQDGFANKARDNYQPALKVLDEGSDDDADADKFYSDNDKRATGKDYVDAATLFREEQGAPPASKTEDAFRAAPRIMNTPPRSPNSSNWQPDLSSAPAIVNDFASRGVAAREQANIAEAMTNRDTGKTNSRPRKLIDISPAKPPAPSAADADSSVLCEDEHPLYGVPNCMDLPAPDPLTGKESPPAVALFGKH
jgi:hypothetical protein